MFHDRLITIVFLNIKIFKLGYKSICELLPYLNKVFFPVMDSV